MSDPRPENLEPVEGPQEKNLELILPGTGMLPTELAEKGRAEIAAKQRREAGYEGLDASIDKGQERGGPVARYIKDVAVPAMVPRTAVDWAGIGGQVLGSFLAPGVGGLAVKGLTQAPRFLKPAVEAATRVLTPAFTGAVAATATGESPGQAALEQGGGAVFGEALGKVIPWLKVIRPGGKMAVMDEHLGQAAKWMNQKVRPPVPLQGAADVFPVEKMTTRQAFRDWVKSPDLAEKRLNDIYGEAVDWMQAKLDMMPGARFTTEPAKISVPSLSPAGQVSVRPQNIGPRKITPQPIDVYSPKQTWKPGVIGDSTPRNTSKMTIREAFDELKKVGEGGWGHSILINPATGTLEVAERRDYGKAMKEIIQSFNAYDPSGELSKTFVETRRMWELGKAALEVFRLPNAVNPSPLGPVVNVPYLTRWAEQNATKLMKRFGDDYPTFMEMLTFGAGPGYSEIGVPGLGRVSDAARQIVGRGQGGAPQIVGGAVRSAVPNIGAELPRNPFATSALGQFLYNVMGQSAASGFRHLGRPLPGMKPEE